MRTINIVCLADGVSVSTDILGRAGEQNAVQLSIDASAVAAALENAPETEAEEPAGLMAALYFRLRTGVALPMDAVQLPESAALTVTVPAWAMQLEGAVRVQLVLTQGTGDAATVLKSYVWEMVVQPSVLPNTDTPPDPVQTWLDEVSEAIDNILVFGDAIDNIAITADTLPPGSQATASGSISETEGLKIELGIPQGIQGPQGPKGENGKGLTILDYYDDLEALQAAVQSPKDGDVYGIGTSEPYDIYIYSPTKGWVNNGKLQGAKGDTGAQGPAGADGATFTPAVDSSGNISWTNDKSLPNPDTVNIRGPQGPAGADGANGQDGAEGPQGPAGPNEVSTTTGTNIAGLLKGNGTTVQQAVAGTDYAKPSNTVYATLLATGWTFEAFNDGMVSQYVARQTVNVSGMTAAATAIVSLNSSADTATAKAAAPLMLRAVAQAEGTVTVEASAVTSASSGGDIPIEIDTPIQITIL